MSPKQLVGEMPVTAYEGEQQFDAIINCDRCGGTGSTNDARVKP